MLPSVYGTVTMNQCGLSVILSPVMCPALTSALKANVLVNSPASCQLFCKETPRSLEQQLQEHR